MDIVQAEECISIQTKQDLTRALEKFRERWIAEINDETDQEPESETPEQFMDEYDISPEELEQMQISYSLIQSKLDYFRDFSKTTHCEKAHWKRMHRNKKQRIGLNKENIKERQ